MSAILGYMVFAACQNLPATLPNEAAESPRARTLAVSPSAVTLPPGDSVQFAARLSDQYGNLIAGRVYWTAGGGSILNTGLYTAPSAPGVYYVVAAESQGLADTATVTVSLSPRMAASLRVSPKAATVAAGADISFAGTLFDQYGDSISGALNWASTGGRIDSEGSYTASVPPGNYLVTARGPNQLADTASVSVVQAQLDRPYIGAAVQLEAFIDDRTLQFDWKRWQAATALLVEGNVDWVRLVFDWRWIEPQQRTLVWDGPVYPYDRVVADLEQRDVSVLGLLLHAPAWASGSAEGGYPPRSLSDFSSFVNAVVSRYRSQIRHWEIWNEPNIGEFWKPTPKVDDYTALLATGYVAAKLADPDCVVISGGLAHSPHVLEWLQNMYDADASLSDYSDAIGLHAYTWNGIGPTSSSGIGSFAVINDAYAVMQLNGDGAKGLWLTEQGWRADAVGDAAQAQYLAESLQIAQTKDFVESYFWFEFIDRFESYGLVRSDLGKRPSFVRFAERP